MPFDVRRAASIASCWMSPIVCWAYGNDFMHDFEPAGTNKNGGFITSCICHGCPWDKLTFEGNKTAYEYYADWANSRDFPREPKNLVIDSRGPNGDGDLTFSECAPFP